MEANTATNMTTVITRGDGMQVLTEQISTNIPQAPVTQCNPLYQPEGPPSDQPTEQPPPYTTTPTGAASGTYAPQSSFGGAPYKPAGVA